MKMLSPAAAAGLAAVTAEQQRRAHKAKPYRIERYGRWADELLRRLHDKRTPLRVFPGGYSIITTKLQYYQGAEWAEENIPGFADLKAATILRTYADYFELHIRQRPYQANAEGPTVHEAANWREEFEVFMDSAVKGQKLDRADVCLTPDDVAYVNSQLAPFVDNGSIVAVVEPHRLFLCKME